MLTRHRRPTARAPRRESNPVRRLRHCRVSIPTQGARPNGRPPLPGENQHGSVPSQSCGRPAGCRQRMLAGPAVSDTPDRRSARRPYRTRAQPNLERLSTPSTACQVGRKSAGTLAGTIRRHVSDPASGCRSGTHPAVMGTTKRALRDRWSLVSPGSRHRTRLCRKRHIASYRATWRAREGRSATTRYVPEPSPAGISSHHWHHQLPPTRMRSFGCQQYERSLYGSR